MKLYILQYWDMRAVLGYACSTGICVQYWDIHAVLQYAYNTGICIQYWDLHTILEYTCNTRIYMYMQYWDVCDYATGSLATWL